MCMEILDGKKVSNNLKDTIKEKIHKEYLLKGKNVPTLACIIVGENPASKVYVQNKKKACDYVGFNSLVIELDEHSCFEEVKDTIELLNQNKLVSGILLQLPLPDNLKPFEHDLIECISPSKDVDGLTTKNLGLLFNNHKIVAPCTATGIMHILQSYDIDLDGKNAVVIGRSLLVGKSVAMLLEEANATVTICHSHTKNLQSITSSADVLIVALGKPNFITKEYVKDGAVVVDVGINRIEGKLVGDVDFDNVKDKCSYITPVPGGVGPMTIAELINNTLILHEHELNKKLDKNAKIFKINEK